MYENITYESILQRMLDRIPDDMDKREGSVIFDALAPAALELQLMYLELDSILNDSFGDTASREFLIRRAAERGLVPKPATFAQLKAIASPADVNIPEGSRFTLGELHYKLVSKLDNGEYAVQCEEAGAVGNSSFGDLIPIEYIKGLENLRLAGLLIPGEDEEETEAFRQRYFASFDKKAFGGNVRDYIEKTSSVAGVGAVKITPVWNGGGTVLVTILDSEYNAASEALISSVKNVLDPEDGTGRGIVPIGHTVTVRTAESVPINVTADIMFTDGRSFDTLKSEIIKAIGNYFLEIRRNWANADESVVRVSQVETRILNIPGVLDIRNTLLNSSSENLTLSAYQIPVTGGVENGKTS